MPQLNGREVVIQSEVIGSTQQVMETPTTLPLTHSREGIVVSIHVTWELMRCTSVSTSKVRPGKTYIFYFFFTIAQILIWTNKLIACTRLYYNVVYIVSESAMRVKFSKPLENVAGLKGSNVVLKCELYKSKGDVQWLKNSQEIAASRHFTIRAEGRVRSLTIHNITEDDAGEYACESKDERTSATVTVNSKLKVTKGRVKLRKFILKFEIYHINLTLSSFYISSTSYCGVYCRATQHDCNGRRRCNI